MEERNIQENGYGAFPVVLKIVAILCVVVGIFAAVNLGTEFNGYWRERNTATTFIYASSGILSGIFWWALSDIVEACQRYIKNNKR